MTRSRSALAAAALVVVVAAGAAGDEGARRAAPTAAVATPVAAPAAAAPQSPRSLVARVIETYPHDAHAFTQGLLFYDGALFESTGLYGHSSLRAVDLSSGAVERKLDLGRDLFGEGLARVGDELFQLTWRRGVALVYRLSDFALQREYHYQGEGWGLCFDGELLVMSDGSQRLFFRDPATFEVVRTVEVSLGGRPLPRLNELECVGDRVYANVWTTSRIVAIDKQSGTVLDDIDASGVLSMADRASLDPNAILNGIAFDERDGTFLVTGKLWPRLLRVRFVDKQK